MTNTPGNVEFILLKLHAGTATISETTTLQICLNIFG
jgi:hypothetical protein